MVARIVAAVAANQSDAQARRIRRKNDERAAAGLPHVSGERAYGYDLDRTTVIDHEAQVIRTCVERFLAGESLVSIAQWLQEKEIKTATGRNDWRTPTLRNLIRSPRIAGLREHRGEVVGLAQWPAIITVQQHEQIVGRLKANAARNQRSPRRYILSGKVFCGLCGAKMYSSPDGGRRRYGCRRGPDFGGCGKQYINAEPLERLIVRAVLARLDSAEVIAAARHARNSDDGAAKLARELETLTSRKDELIDMYATGEIDRRGLLKGTGAIDAQIDAARKALDRIEAPPLAGTAGHGRSIAAMWDSPDMTIQRQAAVITTILDRVIINPAPSKGPRMNPERAEPVWLV
jgi:hypothetical protein